MNVGLGLEIWIQDCIDMWRFSGSMLKVPMLYSLTNLHTPTTKSIQS